MKRLRDYLATLAPPERYTHAAAWIALTATTGTLVLVFMVICLVGRVVGVLEAQTKSALRELKLHEDEIELLQKVGEVSFRTADRLGAIQDALRAAPADSAAVARIAALETEVRVQRTELAAEIGTLEKTQALLRESSQADRERTERELGRAVSLIQWSVWIIFSILLGSGVVLAGLKFLTERRKRR